MVVVDDGDDAAVVRGHCSEVRARQPAEGGALEPLALAEQQVEHLVRVRVRVRVRVGVGVGVRVGVRVKVRVTRSSTWSSGAC